MTSSEQIGFVGLARVCALLTLFAALSFSAAAMSAANSNADAAAATPPSLLDLWLTLERTGPVYGPYTYIRHRKTQTTQTQRQKALLHEVDELLWRLRAAGNDALVQSLQVWRRQIRQFKHFRTPGRWGPAVLLAGITNGVPTTAIAAVGACRVPSWIEIWSADGVRRIQWHAGMHLSSLLDDDGALHDVSGSHVTLVDSYGRISKRGSAAWNEQDALLAPGMRVIAPLPLGGEVKSWLQRTLAQFLAHVTPADHCRQIALQHGAADAGR